LRLQPAGRRFRCPECGAGRRVAHRPAGPGPERMQDPVGPVGRIQVVVEEPGDGLLLLSLTVIAPGPPGGITADEVMEPELAVRGRREQVTVEQYAERLL